MKKIISLVIGLALTLSVSAQNHTMQSFLAGGVNSVVLTNLLNITNLSYASSVGTNAFGTLYTNNGVRVTTGTNVNLFRDVTLWADREGRPYSQVATNTTEASIFNTPVSLCIKTIAGAVADTAVTFVFSPVYNDNVGECTVSTEWFTASVTPTASATQVWRVAVPVYKWPGAKKLRLMYTTNGDTTTGNGSVTVTHLSLNGFIP